MLHTPRHAHLVLVDSDGCVFDNMEVKQIQHFHPLILRHWELDAIEPQFRAVAEYVNLRSMWRGSNRFVALLKVFELLEEIPSIRNTGVILPDLTALREWVESGEMLDNSNLDAVSADCPSLRKVLDWSLEVNRDIATRMNHVPPFDGAADALTLFHARADVIVVSLTPVETLEYDWSTHGLRHDVDAIGGQEWGNKREQIHLAMGVKHYGSQKVLLLGDAPGDLEAARGSDILFYPILPGREVESWRRLLAEDMDAFFQGRYAGELQDRRIAEFRDVFQNRPPFSDSRIREDAATEGATP
jgi:phosphoglycolate phosphatase-like HAD superfamily hydrolase